MGKKEEKHLPVYGIGPMLCWPMAVLTVAGIWMSVRGIIPGAIENGSARILLLIIGILLILEGVALFFGADLHGNLKDNIKANQLKTNGSYSVHPAGLVLAGDDDRIDQYGRKMA